MTLPPTRVKSKSPAQKIGYSSVRHFSNTVTAQDYMLFPSDISLEALDGRLIGSFSGGYYTPFNTSSPGGSAYYYQSKTLGDTWCGTPGYLREYLFKTGEFLGLSPVFTRSPSIGALPRLSKFSLDSNGDSYDECANLLFANEFRLYVNYSKPFSDLRSFHDNTSFPYLPPGIPIIKPKLTSFYQERPFLAPISEYFTDSPSNKLLPNYFFDSGFSSESNIYANALGNTLHNFFGGYGFNSSNLFLFSGPYKVGVDTSKVISEIEYLKRFCTGATSFTDASKYASGEELPINSFTAYGYVASVYGSRLYSPLYGNFYWGANKFPFFTENGVAPEFSALNFDTGIFTSPSYISKIPFVGSLPYINTSDSAYQFKHSIASSDHIDFVVKSLLLGDSVTKMLSFKPLESDLDIWQFSVNCNYIDPATISFPNDATNHPEFVWKGVYGGTTGAQIQPTTPVKHTIVDAKRLVYDWFYPIHEAIPLKTEILPGGSIPSDFYLNCNRQRINIRLDLLDLDVSDFPDDKISVVITNPGIFVGVNGELPSYIFSNGFLNIDEASANIFIDLYFFPYCQFYSDSLSSEVSSKVTTGQVSNPIMRSSTVVSNFCREFKSYYESFGKIGSYFKQTKQIDSAFLNIDFDYDALFGVIGSGDYWTQFPAANAINQHTPAHPTSNFLDYFDSSFDFLIISGHLDPEDIPDPDNIDIASFSNVLYSTKSVPDSEIVSLSSTILNDINTFIKPFTYATIFSEYDPSEEGVLFSYTNSLYTRPTFFLTKNLAIAKFDYNFSRRPFNDKINPFFNLIMAETDLVSQTTALATADRSTPSPANIHCLEYPKTERFPFQLSFLPIPVGPITEPPSYADEVAYIKEFGSFYEFKCFFTGAGAYAPGTLDSFCVGVFATNLSKKIKCYIESVDNPLISSLVSPNTSGLFLSEIDLDTTNSFSTSYQRNGQFYKYPGTQSGSIWKFSTSGGGFRLSSPFPHYSTESGPGLLLQSTPAFELGDASWLGITWNPSFFTHISGQYSPAQAHNKVIDQVADIRFYVLTFRLYVAPVTGHAIIPTPSVPHLPGYIDSGALKADGLLDFKLEFCSPLFDQDDGLYKYVSTATCPDKTQYDSVFRVYTHLLFPKYFKN